MIHTLKDAPVHRFYYESYKEFKEHLDVYLLAFNVGRRLKTLKRLTPFEFICRRWSGTFPSFTGTNCRVVRG